MAMLEIKDLHVHYGVIEALKGISLEVNEGEIVALIGGLFIGIAETMVTAYGSSLYKDAIVYIILILILILKPAGLLGKNVREKV